MRKKGTPRSSLRKRKRSGEDTQVNAPSPKKQYLEPPIQTVKETETALQPISLQETLRSLKNTGRSYTERVDIAFHMWENAAVWESISTDLIYTQLLQWLSYNVTSTFKNPKKEKFYLNHQVWVLLEKIETYYLAPLLKLDFIDKSIVPQETKVSSQLLLALGDFIRDSWSKRQEAHLSTATQLCNLLLKLQWFRPAITMEQYSKFVLQILGVFISDPVVMSSKEYLDHSKLTLEQFCVYLNGQSNHKKLFTVFVEKLLFEFLQVIVAVEKDPSPLSDAKADILRELRECMTNVLFGSTDCSHYGSDKQLVSYHHQLYSKLSELCKQSNEIVYSLPLLLDSFITACRKQITTGATQMMFYESDFFEKLFSFLVDIIREHNPNTMTDGHADAPLMQTLFRSSENMLKLLALHTVNIPNQESINKVVKDFVHCAIHSIRLSEEVLPWTSLTQLLQIQHYVILEHLEAELYPLLVQSTLGDAQIGFIIGLMQLFSKLHQSEKFLKGFSDLIIQKAEIFTPLHSHTKFWIAFAELCLSLSPYKEFEIIWNLFEVQLKKCFGTLQSFDILSQMFIIFLDNVKTSENNAARMKQLIQSSCKNIVYPVLVKVGVFGKSTKVIRKNALFMVSALGLYSCLSTLHNHCESLLFKSYHNSILQTGFLKPSAYFSLLYESQTTNEEVNPLHVFQLVELCSDALKKYPKILYSITLIGLQRIYELHSCSVSVIEDIAKELSSLTSLVITRCVSCWKDANTFLDQKWNRNPSHVSEKNLALALFYLVSQNLFYVCHYLTEDLLQQFLQYIFAPSFLQKAFGSNQHNTVDGSISAGFLLHKICENDQFYELHPIRNALPSTFKILFTQQMVKLLAPLKTNLSEDKIVQLTSMEGVCNFITKGPSHWNVPELTPNSVFEDILYLLALVNAFPSFYLTEIHWQEILPVVYIIEHFISEIQQVQLHDTQYRLLCECRRCFVIATKSHTGSSSKLQYLLNCCFEGLILNSYAILPRLDPTKRATFTSFHFEIFSGINSVELTNSLSMDNNILNTFKTQLESLEQQILKRQISAATLSIWLEWALSWLKSMSQLSSEKENFCIQQQKKLKAKQQTKRVQETTLKIISANQSDSDSESDSSDSESDSSSSDSNVNMKDIKQSQQPKSVTTFKVPEEWLAIENEIYQQLIRLCSRGNDLQSSKEKVQFLNFCLDSFAAVLDTHKIWYSKFLSKNKAFKRQIPKLTNIVSALDIACNILCSLYNKCGKVPALSEEQPEFVTQLQSLWTDVTLPADQQRLQHHALQVLRSVSGSLHLPIAGNIPKEKTLFIVDMIHALLCDNYISYQAQFSPSMHFDDPETLYVLQDNTFVSEMLQIFSEIIRTCSLAVLQDILTRIEKRLQSQDNIHATVALMCFYQCIMQGKNSSRSKLISQLGSHLLSLSLQILYQNSENACVERWTIELLHQIVSSKRHYKFTGNVVASTLTCFPTFIQKQEATKSIHNNQDTKGNADGNGADKTFVNQAAISNPMRMNSSMFVKQCRLLSDCLIHRFVECIHSLPSYIYAVKLLASTLGSMCHLFLHSTKQIISEDDLIRCIRCFSRLLEDIGSKPQATRYYVPTLVTDLIYVLQHYSISPKQRSELHAGLFKLFDVCHEKDRNHVFVLLDNTGKLIFKELFTKYSSEYKFTGKT